MKEGRRPGENMLKLSGKPTFFSNKKFLFTRTTSQSPRLHETLATVAITRGNSRSVFSLVLPEFSSERNLKEISSGSGDVKTSRTLVFTGVFKCIFCTCFLKNKKIKKISKKVLTFLLVYPIIQNVPRMRQTKQRKTTNQAPLAQLVEQ